MAGGPYNIPRNTKGESRFFNIFSTKALIVTGAFGLLAFGITFPIASMFDKKIVSIIITVIFGGIGFIISSFKIPDSNNFELTRKAGGEYIDQIIIRYLKFKRRKNRIYTFDTKEENDE